MVSVSPAMAKASMCETAVAAPEMSETAMEALEAAVMTPMMAMEAPKRQIITIVRCNRRRDRTFCNDRRATHGKHGGPEPNWFRLPLGWPSPILASWLERDWL